MDLLADHLFVLGADGQVRKVDKARRVDWAGEGERTVLTVRSLVAAEGSVPTEQTTLTILHAVKQERSALFGEALHASRWARLDRDAQA